MRPDELLIILIKEHEITDISPETMELLLMNVGLLSQYEPKRALKKKTRKLVKRNSRYEKIKNQEGYERQRRLVHK